MRILILLFLFSVNGFCGVPIDAREAVKADVKSVTLVFNEEVIINNVTYYRNWIDLRYSLKDVQGVSLDMRIVSHPFPDQTQRTTLNQFLNSTQVKEMVRGWICADKFALAQEVC